MEDQVKHRQVRISISFILIVVFLISAIFAGITQFRRPSVRDRANTVIAVETNGLDFEGIKWLEVSLGKRFNSYEFASSKKRGTIVAELDSVVSDRRFEVVQDWYDGNSGYSTFKNLSDVKSGCNVQLSVTWVPVDKENVIRIVWSQKN